jgi:hypothetical protein
MGHLGGPRQGLGQVRRRFQRQLHGPHPPPHVPDRRRVLRQSVWFRSSAPSGLASFEATDVCVFTPEAGVKFMANDRVGIQTSSASHPLRRGRIGQRLPLLRGRRHSSNGTLTSGAGPSRRAARSPVLNSGGVLCELTVRQRLDRRALMLTLAQLWPLHMFGREPTWR